MTKFDGRFKAIEKRIPREYSDGADVRYGPEMDDDGTILNPDEYFADHEPGKEILYIGFTNEQIKRIEEQKEHWFDLKRGLK